VAQPRRRPCGFKVRRLLALQDDDVGRQRSQAPQIGIYRVLVCGDGQAVHHEIVLVAHILLCDPSRARRARRTGASALLRCSLWMAAGRCARCASTRVRFIGRSTSPNNSFIIRYLKL
jgi:hypothetical protein